MGASPGAVATGPLSLSDCHCLRLQDSGVEEQWRREVSRRSAAFCRSASLAKLRPLHHELHGEELTTTRPRVAPLLWCALSEHVVGKCEEHEVDELYPFSSLVPQVSVPVLAPAHEVLP